MKDSVTLNRKRDLLSEITKAKPVSVELVGVDGNAFAVMGAVAKACRRQKWTKEEIALYREVAMSGDYSNLLAVSSSVAYSAKGGE